MTESDAVYIGMYHGVPVFADGPLAQERLYRVTTAYTLGTNPPEWNMPLGWDERWSKI